MKFLAFHGTKKNYYNNGVPESREQAPRHILDNPKVCGEKQHDEYEAGNEGGGEEPAEQVEHQRHQLEEQVEEDH